MIGENGSGGPAVLETDAAKKERWTSIRIIYFTTFLMGLSFGIVLTSIWPYLDSLDPEAGKIFMGWIVAANPMGQMIFSPLIGWWSNKSKTFHAPLLFCSAIFTVSNLWFAVLELFPDNRKYWMFLSRFVIGVSSSNVAICRSYIAAATTIEERTRTVSMVSLMQVLGFIVGPAIQAGMSPLGKDSICHVFGVFPLNMYTVIGWLNVFCGLLNLILCLPQILKYRVIAARQIMLIQNAESEKATWKSRKPDYFSAFTLISAYGILNFIFTLLESLSSPLTMDQFAWSKEESLFYLGLLMAVGAVVAIFGFLLIAPLSRILGENKALIWVGFQLMIVGSLFGIPWGPHTPPMAEPKGGVGYNSSDLGTFANETELLGCPTSQEWCYHTPAVTIPQFIMSYLFISLGYPICLALIPTIFTNVLGPRPQGTWMGMLVGSGCFARMLGPIFITVIYTKFGTRWSFSIISVFQMIVFLWLLLVEKRFTSVANSHKERSNDARGGAGEVEMLPLSQAKDH